MKRPDHSRIGAAQDAENSPFRSAILLAPSQLNQHLVSVHPRANRLRSDIDITLNRAALPGIWDHEAVSIAMHSQPPGDKVLMRRRVLGQSKAVAASLDQASALYERLQPFRELPPLFTSYAHLADELLVSRRAMRLAFNVPKNSLVADQRFCP
jgi:hypothetical protein